MKYKITVSYVPPEHAADLDIEAETREEAIEKAKAFMDSDTAEQEEFWQRLMDSQVYELQGEFRFKVDSEVLTEDAKGVCKVKEISIDELRSIRGKEGLILQGCGGDLSEWDEGITNLFYEEDILPEDERFQEIYSFKYNDQTNVLFIIDDVNMDMGKLAMWRLGTHANFGGTWLSDYMTNKFGIDVDSSLPEESSSKPKCPIIGANGNIFNVLGIASKTLRENGMADAAQEMFDRASSSTSYDQALGIIMEYVEPVSESEMTEDEDPEMSMS